MQKPELRIRMNFSLKTFQLREDKMIVVFRRTGERRYAVLAQRPGFPNLEMNPAPGFDRFMPHDLMHLVVEAQLGLSHAIFGQLASGGDAGTFHLAVQRDESSRKIARTGKRVKARGKRLMKQGRDEALESERATSICWHEWLARSSASEQGKPSAAMAQQTREVRNTAGARELHTLNSSKLDEICKHLDRLSFHWSHLRVGESMTVAWPDLAIVNDAGPGK